MDPLLAGYEALTYLSNPVLYTEPDSLAAQAILHGLTPPPADRCSVLELGCGTGVNLVSMAFRSPTSRFVGVDFSPTEVSTGQLAISEVGLQNITLRVESIGEIDDNLGQFDYVICHGVYSWVPPDIQDAILRVCSRNLTRDGVAYVSYNTYPGWHQRSMVRDMLLFHDDPALPPAQRVARAREVASCLEPPSDDRSIHAAMLRDEIAQLRKQTDHHLFHEQLSPYNEPLYFAEFARRAAQHGLQYVAEARPFHETPTTSRARASLDAAHDVVKTEQHLDFIVGRTFRTTLLCHEGVRVSPTPIGGAVERLCLSTRAFPVAPDEAAAERGPGVGLFRTPLDASITTNNPLVLTMLEVLADVRPTAVAFSDLRQEVAARLHASPAIAARTMADDPSALIDVAIQCASGQLIELRSIPSGFVARPGTRPNASALARWQAGSSAVVSTLGHWAVRLSGAQRFLLPHLDGTNDHDQLVRLTERALASGDLTFEGRPDDAGLPQLIDEVLTALARSALLVS